LTVRRATAADIPRIMEMGRKFHAAHQPPWPWDDASTADVVAHIINGGFAAVTDSGFILGVLAANPISRDWIVAKEFIWWAEDRSGLALLAAFRAWAKEQGANEIQLSCPPGRAEAAYRRHGSASEIIYSEVV
jgi:hypothetical protein